MFWDSAIRKHFLSLSPYNGQECGTASATRSSSLSVIAGVPNIAPGTSRQPGIGVILGAFTGRK
jgi:hypothetical protein